MRHFPIYVDTAGKTIAVSGAGQCALAKIRLLIRTEANITVFGPNPEPELVALAAKGALSLFERGLGADDLSDVSLLYAANDDAKTDAGIAALGREARIPTLIVDNLEASDFITPAIVDRTPVTVAIGTEGTAPVLARKIKAEIEGLLPSGLGTLARIAKSFRPLVAKLKTSRARRDFWTQFYFDAGPWALDEGETAVKGALTTLLEKAEAADMVTGQIAFVGAGPGDPDLLTLKARDVLHDADVVLHDGLVPQPILDLVRREALIIAVGKTGFGPSWTQDDINALLVEHGHKSQVVRLKSGDGGVFGRLDEEIEAVEAAGIDFTVVPGITSASAAAAVMKTSMTRRDRNTSLRLLSAHDAKGFSEQDWEGLSKPGAVAAIYMGKAAAAFIQGRLMMHGANPTTPVTIVENASRPDQQIIEATLRSLKERVADIKGPAILMLGLEPRQKAALSLKEAV